MRVVHAHLQKPVAKARRCRYVSVGPREIANNRRWIRGQWGGERGLQSLHTIAQIIFFAGHRLAGSGRARIHFLEGMCDGISNWTLADEFFTRSRNLSQIFPEHTRHCPGDAGYKISPGGMHIKITHGNILSYVYHGLAYN